MSDFGRSGEGAATSGDRWRYAWLAVLGVLVLSALLSRVDGTLVVVLAVLLVAAAAAGLAVVVRRSRS